MFAIVRRFPLLKKSIIAVFSIPLMFAGGSFLGGLTQNQTVGSVGDIDIPTHEYNRRYQNALEAFRRQNDSDEIPVEIANRISSDVQGDLLAFYLLQASVEQKKIHAPDRAVIDEIREVEDFQDEDGEFSPELYREFVTDRRYYQEQVRDSIGREVIFRALEPLPVPAVREKIANFRRQQRVVDAITLPLNDLTTLAVDIPQEDINLYYQQNVEDYRILEEGGFEYFIIEQAAFAESYDVSEDDIQAAYDDFIDEQAAESRRQVSHIYIGDEELALEIAEQAQAAPDDFAALAEEYSEDAGSATNGGFLGIVTEDDLPLAMSEALLTMTVGQVHAPVYIEEQDGYSILKLDGVINRNIAPLDELRERMTARARLLASQDDFDEQIALIEENAPVEIGALQGLATLSAVSISIAVAQTVYTDALANTYPFNDETVLLELFDSAITQDGENSAPIPLSDTAYLVARSTRYQSAGHRPIEEVAPEVEAKIRASYMVLELERQLELLNQSQILTIDVDEDAEPLPYRDSVRLIELLDEIEWTGPHTVALTDYNDSESEVVPLDDEAAADEAGRLPAADAVLGESGISEQAGNLIFSVDLSYGLPTYAFYPDEGEVSFYRVREVHAGEAQATDFLVADEIINRTSARLINIGYLEELARAFNFDFYNVPEVASQ